MATAFSKFSIRKLPAFTDRDGTAYPDRFDIALVCSRGMRWDGGEYATRDEAVAAATKRVSA